MATKSSFVSFDGLLQELESIESDIWKLFAIQPMPSTQLIDSKVHALVELISRIPPQYGDLVGEWNTKVNKLIEKLAEMSKEKQSSLINVATLVPVDSGHSVGIDAADGNNNQLCPQTSSFQSAFLPLSVSEEQLISLETCIEQMFASSPAPLGALEARIGELTEEVWQIPTKELQSHWNDKLNKFVEKYLLLSSLVSSSIAQSKDTVDNPQPVDNIASQGMSIHKEQTKPSSESGLTSSSVAVAQEGASKIQLMERAFGTLSQCDLADMTTFRKLLTLTAKAKAYTEHAIGSNRSLQTKCFSLALAKLPARSQEEYSNEEGKKNLTTLANYLFGLIKAHADNLEQQQLAQSLSGDEYSNLFNCQYCKKTGHQVTFCPSRKATFCYNCFQFGHSIKRCPAEPLRTEDISRLF